MTSMLLLMKERYIEDINLSKVFSERIIAGIAEAQNTYNKIKYTCFDCEKIIGQYKTREFDELHNKWDDIVDSVEKYSRLSLYRSKAQ